MTSRGTFFEELGAETITSPDTCKEILDDGVRYCIDEACLPVKVFHGHVAAIKDKCDLIVIPRIMQLRSREFICPKFCGLPEMVVSSVPGITQTTAAPIYATSKSKLYGWAKDAGRMVTKELSNINRAFEAALQAHKRSDTRLKSKSYAMNVALIGHPYTIHDDFINMGIVKNFIS